MEVADYGAYVVLYANNQIFDSENFGDESPIVNGWTAFSYPIPSKYQTQYINIKQTELEDD